MRRWLRGLETADQAGITSCAGDGHTLQRLLQTGDHIRYRSLHSQPRLKQMWNATRPLASGLPPAALASLEVGFQEI